VKRAAGRNPFFLTVLLLITNFNDKELNMKKAIIVLLALFAVSGSLFAADTIQLDKAKLEWSIDSGSLTITFTAETDGWVAVGLGSNRMDGANIFIGYNKDGEPAFREDIGSGHSHREAEVQRPVKFEVTESNGMTVMSFTVAASDFVKTGQTTLPFIVAYGSRDNFNSIHRYRNSGTIRF